MVKIKTHRNYKTIVKRIAAWEDELKTNAHGFREQAEIHIPVLKKMARRYELECLDEPLTVEEIENGCHFCHEYDGMVICKDDPEYENCGCHVQRMKKLVEKMI